MHGNPIVDGQSWMCFVYVKLDPQLSRAIVYNLADINWTAKGIGISARLQLDDINWPSCN